MGVKLQLYITYLVLELNKLCDAPFSVKSSVKCVINNLINCKMRRFLLKILTRKQKKRLNSR